MGMSNLSEPDARMATQTLLDIAIKANKRRNDAQSSGGSKASRGVGKGRCLLLEQRISSGVERSFPVVVQDMDNYIT